MKNIRKEQNMEEVKKVRAKFVCDEVATTVSGKKVSMSPVTSGSEENESFFKWTPFGKLEMGVVNPDVEFIPGQEYFIDFTPA
jgi:hypothetical protein